MAFIIYKDLGNIQGVNMIVIDNFITFGKTFNL